MGHRHGRQAATRDRFAQDLVREALWIGLVRPACPEPSVNHKKINVLSLSRAWLRRLPGIAEASGATMRMLSIAAPSVMLFLILTRETAAGAAISG